MAEKEGVAKRGVFQRKSKMGRGGGEGSISNSKHYAKMGLVMDSPTKGTPQWPQMMPTHKAVSVGGVDTRRSVSVQADEVGGVALQPSPPICVKLELVENNRRNVTEERDEMEEGEAVMSSPDSGYGNTPDQPLGSEHLGRVQPIPMPPGRTRSGAIRGIEELNTKVCDAGGLGLRSSSDIGGMCLRGSEAGGLGLRGSDVGGLGLRVSSDVGGLELGRQRQDTQDSAFFMDGSPNRETYSSSILLQRQDTFPFYKGASTSSLVAGEAERASHTQEMKEQLYHRPSPSLSGLSPRPYSSVLPSSTIPSASSTISHVSSSTSPYMKRKKYLSKRFSKSTGLS